MSVLLILRYEIDVDSQRSVVVDGHGVLGNAQPGGIHRGVGTGNRVIGGVQREEASRIIPVEKAGPRLVGRPRIEGVPSSSRVFTEVVEPDVAAPATHIGV